ncbi:protein phosphatase Slingshot 2-like protein, partial [Dinothrombium tinctorium]
MKDFEPIVSLLRPEDTIKMAVKLESLHPSRVRCLAIVSCKDKSRGEGCCLLGIDYKERATIGLVLPIWADTRLTLDGDGGFSVTSCNRHHIFKPISVQAMWFALQALYQASAEARQANYFRGGYSHYWTEYYEKKIESDQSCLNEWNKMSDLISKRPLSPDLTCKPTDQQETEHLIRAKLKEVMKNVNLDEVTSKDIRTKLELALDMNLNEYKSFIDQEMLTILGQMDSPSEICEYLYLGTEWNASNLEELKHNGITRILNVSREIDNFYPGIFDYYNVRVYDDETAELLRHWEETYRYIQDARKEGGKVLVHCKMGISRSASVVIAYLMKFKNWNLSKSLEYVKKKRNCIQPNTGFLEQLEVYQGILNASKQRHNSLWKSKSESNISSSSSSSSSPSPIKRYFAGVEKENDANRENCMESLIT